MHMCMYVYVQCVFMYIRVCLCVCVRTYVYAFSQTCIYDYPGIHKNVMYLLLSISHVLLPVLGPKEEKIR